MTQSNTHILKVLTGAQTGVEVSLGAGEYILGSGTEDDLQFVDVSLKPGHARLKIEDGSIHLAGGAGGLSTQSGTDIAVGDEDWRKIDDLDVITIGTTALAIGRTNAKWEKAASYRDSLNAKQPAEAKRLIATRSSKPATRSNRALWAGALVLFAVIGASGLIGVSLGDRSQADAADTRPELEVVQEALAEFPFGNGIAVRQEVDGVIFANGYVEQAVERRALLNAVDDTNIAVRMRIFVRSSIEDQIAAVIENQNLPVTFQLSDNGTATFLGDVLDKTAADRFLTTINQDISGISEVTSRIKTAETYLDAVRQLSERSELNDQVLFRLDGQLIEASGIIGSEKLDNWVGFIQSYARRYADRIPLRSFVQLVNENGEVIANPVSQNPGAPIVIGKAGEKENGTVLDLKRLKEGAFNAKDVFEGLDQGTQPVAEIVEIIQSPEEQGVAARDLPTRVLASLTTTSGEATASSQEATANLSSFANDLLNENSATNQEQSDAQTRQAGELDIAAIRKTVAELKKRWGKALDNNPGNLPLRNPDDIVTSQFLPLVISPARASETCWNNSELTRANLPVVLFWLDLLSVSDQVDVSDLDVKSQHLLLEAALSPAKVLNCAVVMGDIQDFRLDKISLFLEEIQRNPDFIRFIVRNLDTSELPITGVMVGQRVRYVQTVNGLRVREGASPDTSSKLASVGELGVLVRNTGTMTTIIYGEDLAWKSEG